MNRRSWAWLLLAVVGANVAGGVAFTLDTRLYPSWVVYPLFLVIGSVRLFRGQRTTGVVFLTITALVFIVVHFPFTPFGPEGSECDDCTRAIAWIALTLLPVALLVTGIAALRDLRRTI